MKSYFRTLLTIAAAVILTGTVFAPSLAVTVHASGITENSGAAGSNISSSATDLDDPGDSDNTDTGNPVDPGNSDDPVDPDGPEDSDEPEDPTKPKPAEPTETQTITAANIKASFGDAPFAITVELPDSSGGLSYTSSDSKIAEIDENGIITIHQIGSAKITITAGATDKYKKSTKTITLTVGTGLTKPTAPVITNTGSGVQIAWTKDARAQGYYLYRKSSGGTWALLDTLSGADSTTYHDTTITTGLTYAYRVYSYTASGAASSSAGTSANCRYMTAPAILRLAETSGGNSLLWSKSTGASGYRVYRKSSKDSSWTMTAQLTSVNNCSWTDINVTNGVYYTYRIAAYYLTSATSSESVPSGESSILRLKTPTTVKQSSISAARKMTVKWTKNSSADGYQVQYASNSLFTSMKTKTVKGAATNSLTLTGLNKKNTYFVRVRSYKTVNGQKYYSAWNVSSKVKSTRSAAAAAVKSGKSLWELRAKSKQTLYQYDTVQGSCTDGTYAYFAMYNRTVEKCRIVKVRLSTMKVVKTSATLSIAHGNDLTYIPEKKCIAAVHYSINTKRISLISTSTLKVKESKDITIPSGLSGATTAERKAITGFCGISYNASRRQYVVLLSKSHNFLILNESMEAISYVKASKKYSYTYQGIDTTDDYIIVAMSPNGAGTKNSIAIYTWDGTFISQVATKAGYEMEGVFHAGKQFYAVSYRSYYKIYYTKQKKTVTVKVKGKTKKKKVTVKVRHRKLMRDNYIYKLTKL